MAILKNGQSGLEYKGIEERQNETVRSDYNKENEYSATHKDALSDGDPLGKGVGSGGHTHWLPDPTKPAGMIDYSNFNTSEGGGQYDIEGRNDVGGRKKAMNSSLYNKENQYGAHLVNTEENIAQGQFFFGQTTKHI